MKILNETKIYITLIAMLIGFAFYLWNGKIFWTAKVEQKVIVSDESQMEAIHEMEDMAREINCISTCYDDDAERSCLKKCQTESKKRSANRKEIKENTPTKLSENEMNLLIVNCFKRHGYHLENSKEIIKEEVKKDNTKTE